QALDLLAADARLKAEVEVAEQLHRRQSAGAHRRLETAVVAELDLGGEDLLDGLGRGEGAAIDALKDGVERLQGAGHLQIRQHTADAVPARRSALHRTPPASAA